MLVESPELLAQELTFLIFQVADGLEPSVLLNVFDARLETVALSTEFGLFADVTRSGGWFGDCGVDTNFEDTVI